MSQDKVLAILEERLGHPHVRLRLGVESDHEAQAFGQGINFFHIENMPVGQAVIRTILMVSGLYWRGRRNAGGVVLKQNLIQTPQLPKHFDDFTILQISDLHVEESEAAIMRIIEIVETLPYDLCLLTGDYRTKTWGPYDASSPASLNCAPPLKVPPTASSEITTRSAWCRDWRRWA